MIKLKKKNIKVIDRQKKIILKRLYDYKKCSPNYVNWLSDKVVNKYLEVRFRKISIKEIKKNIKESFNSDNNLLMGIYFKTENLEYEHVGNIKAQINITHLHGDISIIIGEKKYFNQRIASTAIKIFSKYLFEKLKLQKLSAGAYQKNVYSLKAFKSAGYKFEARLIKNRIFKNKRCDEVKVYKLKVK